MPPGETLQKFSADQYSVDTHRWILYFDILFLIFKHHTLLYVVYILNNTVIKWFEIVFKR